MAGIGPGTELDWRYDPVRRVLIGTRREDAGRDDPGRFARLRGILRGRMTTDEILALTRGEPDE
jgi:hypothetical protein